MVLGSDDGGTVANPSGIFVLKWAVSGLQWYIDRRQEQEAQRVVVNEDRVVPVDKLVMVYVLQAAGFAAEYRSPAETVVRVAG